MWPRFQEKMWVSQTKQASTKSVRQVARWVRSKKWRIRSSGVSDCKEREPASGGSGDGSLIKVLSPHPVRSQKDIWVTEWCLGRGDTRIHFFAPFNWFRSLQNIHDHWPLICARSSKSINVPSPDIRSSCDPGSLGKNFGVNKWHLLTRYSWHALAAFRMDWDPHPGHHKR